MEITDIRLKIDEIDEQMLALFLERMALSEAAAASKKAQGLPLVNKERERQVLARVAEKSGPLEQYAHYLFASLIELSKARQREIYAGPSPVAARIEAALKSCDEVFPKTGLVACQGTEGANSQAACDKLLPRGRIMYFKTFEAVFDAVDSGLCQYGVLPIENSSNGSVRAVYELLQRKRFAIVRATNLFIRHELLARPGVKLSQIREIYSHEQALGQCGKFLASLGPGVKIIPCDNTAVAAKIVAESGQEDCAAIAAHACAGLYGLEVVEDQIQDSDNNYTRFICIAREPAIYAGANRISLIISCDNSPGALYGILAKLAVRGVNMSKLESYPVLGGNFEFMFFLELDASVREPGVLSMLAELEQGCGLFNFLGSYALV